MAFALAMLGASLAVCAAAGWSFSLDIGVLRVSLRHATNPAAASVLGLAFSRWWLGDAGLRALTTRVDAHINRHAGWLAGALGVFVFVMAWQWGAFVAGGTDSSGYLSQARLWQEGSTRTAATEVDGVTFANGLRVITPVGFRPDFDRGDLVPMYPPGLPLAMAGLGRLAGTGAQFLVVPISAGLLTVVAFVLGRRLGGPIVGLLAAGATGSSPTMLYQAFQPMSDVPASCAWLVAVAAVWMSSMPAALGASLAAVVACVVRPNLFAMVPLLGLAAAWSVPSWRFGAIRAAVVSVPVILAGLGYAWWQREMFGGATDTGYGEVNTLFSLAHVWPNLATYPRWLVESHGYLPVLAVAAPLVLQFGRVTPVLPRARATRLGWWSMIMCAALVAFYAVYLPFDSWTYTRFLLPALPLAFVLASITLMSLVSFLPQPWRTPIVILMLVAVPCVGWARTRDVHAFDLWHNERRYVEIADFTSAQPASAVFLCMQHSGSLAYYTGRPIVRWDWIEPTELDRVVGELAATGRTVYAVLDDWEVAAFQSRFPGSATAATLQTPVFRSGERVAIAALVFLVRPAAGATGT